MSGGLAVKKKMRDWVRAGAKRLHGPLFFLDGLGVAGPPT
jgi:hypothetical protein